MWFNVHVTRTQIIDRAKNLVASKGADTVLEFGSQCVNVIDETPEEVRAIVFEAMHQAHRVLRFLGLE